MISRLATIIRLIVIVTAVPLILISTNVRCVVNASALYSYGFEKYDIDDVTGIEMDQLRMAGGQIRDYFDDDSELITVKVKRYGEAVPNIYSEREVLHMKDVKNLLGLVYSLQIIALIVGSLGIATGLAMREKASLARSIRWVCRGGGVTLGITILVGLLALGGFDKLFLYFHLISFDNDLWLLDPSKDLLIMMFPQEFFFDATILIVSATVLEAIALWFAPIVIRKFWNI